ncbi:MAG: serine/threonine-protein kinase [Polyangiaceae bacterium]
MRLKVQTPCTLMGTGAGSTAEEIAQLCCGTSYEVVRFLGRGGIGQVWVVQHKFLKREFALKVLHRRLAADARAIDRLRFEAQVTAALEHPNIVSPTDFWLTDEGRPCLVMELLEGRNLARELVERGPLPAREVLAIGCEVLSAVEAAHRNGLLHRDIKPENVFLHELAGRQRIARLLDFGIARFFREIAGIPVNELAERTRTGMVVGSPRYMSPEARRGASLDERADVYSVGITLYEALTGQGPYDRSSSRAPPQAPSLLVQGVTKELDAAILQAIAQEPSQRYASAAEFEAKLREFLPLRRSRGCTA